MSALLRFALALVAINLVTNVALLGAGYDLFIPWKAIAYVSAFGVVLLLARVAEARER